MFWTAAGSPEAPVDVATPRVDIDSGGVFPVDFFHLENRVLRWIFSTEVRWKNPHWFSVFFASYRRQEQKPVSVIERSIGRPPLGSAQRALPA